MSQDSSRTVPFGPYELKVVPQRIAYLQRNLGKMLAGLQDVDSESTEGLVSGLGDRAYDVLGVLIPDLPAKMQRHEFAGYATAADYDSAMAGIDVDPVDAEDDRSPTFPELVGAFRAAMEVNQFDLFKRLGNVFSADLLKSALNVRLADWLTKNGDDSQT